MSETRPRSFRPGEDSGAAPAPPGLAFTPAADAGGTDRDVLLGYQVFLGRDPESSFVIADAKSSPVGAFIRALMGSGEFQSVVLDRLAAGRPLPHEAACRSPTPEQLDWLFRLVRVPRRAEDVLRAAPSWAEWLRTLVAIPGVSTAPARTPGVDAQAAGEGFVMITIEQPKPGAALVAGGTIQGAGWAIAPADIADVSVSLDGVRLTHARYGLPRPDVARSFPHYRHVDHCGFTFAAQVPSPLAPSAAGQLVVTVRGAGGEVGRKGLQLKPPGAAGEAAGSAPGAAETAWPVRLAVEEAVVDAGRVLRVRGWAVSAGPMRSVRVTLGCGEAGAAPDSEAASGELGASNIRLGNGKSGNGKPGNGKPGNGKPGNVTPGELKPGEVMPGEVKPGGSNLGEVNLGEVELGEARHGQPRPDIAAAHPTYGNAGQSGFALARRLDQGLPPGPGYVRVRAADAAGHVRQAIAPVVLPPRAQMRADIQAGAGANTALQPPAVTCVCTLSHLGSDGALQLEGWAAAQGGVAGIEVVLDGVSLGQATLDLTAATSAPQASAAQQADGQPMAGAALQTGAPPPARAAPKAGAARKAGAAAKAIAAATAATTVAAPKTVTAAQAGAAQQANAAQQAVAAPQAHAAPCGFSFVATLARPPAQGAHRLVLHVTGVAGARLVQESVVLAGSRQELAGSRPSAAALPALAASSAEVAPARSAIEPSPADGPQSMPDLRLELDGAVGEGGLMRVQVGGALAVSGWALARHGIARVSVFCDDALLGHAHLGMRREDIGAAFPDYEGSLLSGYGMVLPPASLPEGEHRIRVVAYAAGRTASQTVPAGPNAGPANTARADASRTDAGRTKGAQIAAAKTDAARTAAAKTDAGRTDAARTDAAQTAAAGTDAARTDAARTDAAPLHAAGTERSFRVLVEPAGVLPPDSRIRPSVPPAEAACLLGLLRRDLWQPRFEIVLAPAPGAACQPEAVAATLRSLHAQAYQDWAARVVVADQAAAETIRALPEWPGAAGRVTVVTDRLASQLGRSKAKGRSAVASTAAAPATAREAAPAVGKAAVNLRQSESRKTSRKPEAPSRYEPGTHDPGTDAPGTNAPGTHEPGTDGPRTDILAASRPAYVMRLRPGDRLGADALLEFALESAASRDAGLIYADEVCQDRTQSAVQPRLKPAWSPELLVSTNYIGRAWCAASLLLDRAGLTQDALAAASDYDLALRLAEHAGGIASIPRILCSLGGAADSDAEERAALQAAMTRRAVAATLRPGTVPGTWRVQRDLAAPAPAARRRRGPVPGRVSVVMPTCAARGLVRAAIASIRATTAPAVPDGREVEIVVVDNTPPHQAEDRAWLRAQADLVVDMPGAFNWSRFNNQGARSASGEFLLFLNDDVDAPAPGWLEALLEHAQRPEVGVVGARLLYPDGLVQHAGQYLADGHARHAFRFADAAAPGPFGLAMVTREVAAVTGACQMVRAEVFARLGGFDEAHSVVNNDVDFCLRARQAGLAVLYTPHATLTHHELASRAALQDSYDEQRFAGAWRTTFLRGDPYRNPHLEARADDYAADSEPAILLHAGRRGPLAETVRRILVLKLDHIGDFLTALPALRSLRRHFPAARIDLLAPSATAQLASAEPAIAETIVFDFFHARSVEGVRPVDETALRALAARLAPAAYDVAIDLRMHPDTRGVLQHTGAGFLAGYDHQGRFGFLDVALEWEGDEQLAAKRAHVSERLVQLVSALADACRADPPPGLAIPREASPPAALAALPAAFRARPIVCVHPGVGNAIRQWPAAHYAGLIDLLAEDGLHSVLVGAPEEASIAEDILRRIASSGMAESLVGRVRLAELAQVMRACVLFVGNNSGPQHLAACLGLPTVGIHSGVVDAAEWAPLGAQAVAIRRRMACSPCYLEFASDCPREMACLTGLRPRDVLAACRRLLKK